MQPCRCSGFTFPGPRTEWLLEAAPLLQWRDRAGFAPDFPVTPVAGTRTDKRYTTTSEAQPNATHRCRGLSSSTDRKEQTAFAAEGPHPPKLSDPTFDGPVVDRAREEVVRVVFENRAWERPEVFDLVL
jgi:hypothetical protein